MGRERRHRGGRSGRKPVTSTYRWFQEYQCPAGLCHVPVGGFRQSRRHFSREWRFRCRPTHKTAHVPPPRSGTGFAAITSGREVKILVVADRGGNCARRFSERPISREWGGAGAAGRPAQLPGVLEYLDAGRTFSGVPRAQTSIRSHRERGTRPNKPRIISTPGVSERI